jgi:hypothetical protein
MKALSMDMARASLAEASHHDKASTLLELLGVDTHAKLRNSIQVYQTASIDTISTGGQSNVTAGSTMQISIRDQGTILFLDRTCVCGELSVPYNVDGTRGAYLRNAS